MTPSFLTTRSFERLAQKGSPGLQKEQKSQGLRSQISALLLEQSSFCFAICFVSKCVYYPVAFSRSLYRKGITCFINDITFQKRICMFDSEITCLTKACICINENTRATLSRGDQEERTKRSTTSVPYASNCVMHYRKKTASKIRYY